MPELDYSSLTFTQNPKRDFDIFTRVEAGETIEAVARSYGLSGQRGWQIVWKMRRMRERRKSRGDPWPVSIGAET